MSLLAFVLGLSTAAAVVHPHAAGGADFYGTGGQQGDVLVTGERAAQFSASEGRRTAEVTTYAFKRLPDTVCGSLDAPGATPGLCVDGAATHEVVRTCEDGSTALDPLFRRPVDPASGLFTGPWEQVDDGGCAEDPPVTVTLSAEDFRRLPLAPSTPSYQPADGRGLVNMPLVVFTDPSPQTLTTTVLGVPVTVRATPVQFTWDFGDGGSPLVTTDPGAPYPDHTVARPYGAPGEYAVRLVTTWRGEFQVAGAGPWIPVDRTATTSSAPFTTTVEEAVPRLVSQP